MPGIAMTSVGGFTRYLPCCWNLSSHAERFCVVQKKKKKAAAAEAMESEPAAAEPATDAAPMANGEKPKKKKKREAAAAEDAAAAVVEPAKKKKKKAEKLLEAPATPDDPVPVVSFIAATRPCTRRSHAHDRHAMISLSAPSPWRYAHRY